MNHQKAATSQLRILIVKTSSMGDVIHNLPVVVDIMEHYPDSQIEWMVEESFSSIPKMHPAVSSVIPVAIRRWRKSLLSRSTWHELSYLRSTLKSRKYDYIIDTQGLIKSALLTRLANGLICGFDWSSLREPLASMFYQRTFHVSKELHAVERNRTLVSLSLGYKVCNTANFGISTPSVPRFEWLHNDSYAVFLHSTSRADKLWDDSNWHELGRALSSMNLFAVLPWGNEVELQRSRQLADRIPHSICPPKLSIENLSVLLAKASFVVGVDTGLSHLASSLGVPTIGIYTSTDPALTGLYPGPCIINLGSINQSPTVSDVITALHRIMPCR